MNFITIYLQTKIKPGLVLFLLLYWGEVLAWPAEAQVFSNGNLTPSLIPIPNLIGNPNHLIPQLIPTLPGDTSTCSPFQRNLEQCLNQYRNIRIPPPVLRSIVPNPPTPTTNPQPISVPAPTTSVSPPPLPAPGTVTAENCPPSTQLVLLPGGYACMQMRP